MDEHEGTPGPDELSESPPTSPPTFLGSYQLLQEIGRGGLARVYRARHVHPGHSERAFAVKVLHDELSRDANIITLFRREAVVLSMLRHANTVRTFEAGVDGGRLFIAMEFVAGCTLRALLARCRQREVDIPTPVALHIVAEVLTGLAAAHSLCDADDKHLNLVHRDVNPANVFISYRSGAIKLGDFGIAVMTGEHVEKKREIAGTVGFFSPEQLAGNDVRQSADVFAIGALMFELVCGRPLFDAKTFDKTRRLNERAKIPRPTSIDPGIPPQVEEVVLRALSRKASERFPTAGDMLEELKPCLPEPSGMPLAVGALVRRLFRVEVSQELVLRSGLKSRDGRDVDVDGQLVAVYSGAEKTRQALSDLLLANGYWVEVHPSVDTLGLATGHGLPAGAVLLDLSGSGFTAERTNASFAKATSPVPIIAVVDTLSAEPLRLAHQIGAVDLLIHPLAKDDVLTSLRAVLSGAVRSLAQRASIEDDETRVRTKIILVSGDQELADGLVPSLEQQGYEVDVTSNPLNLRERSEQTSYPAAIVDLEQGTSASAFDGVFRSLPGMGLPPIVFLSETEDSLAAVERCALRSRADPPATIGATVGYLLADCRFGRTYTRYTVRFPVELRYGGRSFDGQVLNISRGGVFVRYEHLAAVGTEVGVSIRVPDVKAAIEARGSVVRVQAEADGPDGFSAIGVELTQYAGGSEAELIKLISRLDSTSAAALTATTS